MEDRSPSKSHNSSVLYLRLYAFLLGTLILFSCGKGGDDDPTPVTPPPATASLLFSGLRVNGLFNGYVYHNINRKPVLKFSFSAPLNSSTAPSSISMRSKAGAPAAFSTSFENNDSTMVVTPTSELGPLTQYDLTVGNDLRSKAGGLLQTAITVRLTTAIDSTDKFPLISDEALLTLVQQRTFRFFWDFAHPVSGMIRDRNQNPDIVTTGGTGMGVMAIVTAIHRNFITRAEGLTRTALIVDFLKTKATSYHGAFAHFINGNSGVTIPFSQKDNGADLVETSLLMQGLLTARQYFNGSDATETKLRTDINELWNRVEWSWFRKGNENVLYWHWSPQFNWDMNMKIQGWNEALITYVLAAASTTWGIPKEVYDNGWAVNGSMKNGNNYLGTTLPLGPPLGGPLFFAHYSFLGINPKGLTDAYANYWEQNVAHSLINYNYCRTNPKSFNGYSGLCWGLTASDDNISGYGAHSPTNDPGVISPTAAISSIPYTPAESMNALRFFYYKLGDRIWKDYGFTDAFNLHELWFAESFLAIDQGPQIIMIENYRSGLLWNLFMSCPEVKSGLTRLGFSY
ncbi:glucoamylase family protein [Flavitalea antarctica]